MPEFPDTRHSLIQRVHDVADEVAWMEFLAIYQPVVYRMARRRGLQDADAQDVIQKVFLSISRVIGDWKASDEQPPFRAWLTTVARNAITNALSRQPQDGATGSSSVVEVLEAEPAPEDTTFEIIMEARREIVHRAAEQIRSEFSERTWDMFWNTSVEGQSVADVAAAMERSVGAIYVARHRVLTRLKEAVAEMSQQWSGAEGVTHQSNPTGHSQ